MTNTLKTIPVADLKIGTAYKIVAACAGVRVWDWRTVLLTEENISEYANGKYWIQRCTEKHADILLAAGWRRMNHVRNECGMEITTRGKLFGLACSKPGYWGKNGCEPMCNLHAVQNIDAI